MNDKASAILAGVSLTPVFRLQLFVMVCFLMPGVSLALVSHHHLPFFEHPKSYGF